MLSGQQMRSASNEALDATSTESPSELQKLHTIIDQLTSSKGCCPWIVTRSASDCFDLVRSECDEALLELEAQTHASACNSSLDALVGKLGELLSVVLIVVAKTTADFGYAPSDAYWSAVDKIQWRTPYMADWGDGIASAATKEEAMAHWQRRKALRKHDRSADRNAGARRMALQAMGGSGESRFLFVVAQLTAPAGCPWTRYQEGRELLQYLKGECQEAIQEIHGSATPIESGHAEGVVSELGDVLFCVFMAIFLAARDLGFEPSAVIRNAAESKRWQTLQPQS